MFFIEQNGNDKQKSRKIFSIYLNLICVVKYGHCQLNFNVIATKNRHYKSISKQ